MRRPYKLTRQNLDQIKILTPTAIHITKQSISKDKSPIHLHNHKSKLLTFSALPKEAAFRPLNESRL